MSKLQMTELLAFIFSTDLPQELKQVYKLSLFLAFSLVRKTNKNERSREPKRTFICSKHLALLCFSIVLPIFVVMCVFLFKYFILGKGEE